MPKKSLPYIYTEHLVARIRSVKFSFLLSILGTVDSHVLMSSLLDTILKPVEIRRICRPSVPVTQSDSNGGICLWKDRKHCWKRGNAGYQDFPFSYNVFKSLVS